LLGVSLSQSEWDRANGQKQHHVKGASNKMRFDGGIDLFFQFFVTLVIFEIGGSNLGEIGRAVRGWPYMEGFLLVKSAKGIHL
jgi:hypothetical protein